MKYRKMSNDLDYTFGRKPDERYYYDGNAVVQAIITRLNLLKNEWWETLEDGLPLFQEIISYYNNTDDIDLILTDRILGTRGVGRIYNISSSRNNKRLYSYSATIETIYGDIENISLEFDGVHFYSIRR